MRSVAAYAAGSVFENFLICAAVKRSNAREPVRCASAWPPPTAASISAHSADVLESIQMGAIVLEKIPPICSTRGRAGSSLASVGAACAFR